MPSKYRCGVYDRDRPCTYANPDGRREHAYCRKPAESRKNPKITPGCLYQVTYRRPKVKVAVHDGGDQVNKNERPGRPDL